MHLCVCVCVCLCSFLEFVNGILRCLAVIYELVVRAWTVESDLSDASRIGSVGETLRFEKEASGEVASVCSRCWERIPGQVSHWFFLFCGDLIGLLCFVAEKIYENKVIYFLMLRCNQNQDYMLRCNKFHFWSFGTTGSSIIGYSYVSSGSQSLLFVYWSERDRNCFLHHGVFGRAHFYRPQATGMISSFIIDALIDYSFSVLYFYLFKFGSFSTICRKFDGK